MDNERKEIPGNFYLIKDSVIFEKSLVLRTIVNTEKCYFYDTCAFRNHSMVQDKEALLEYIQNTAGVVVLTVSVLMELCSGDGFLWESHINYILEMHQQGIKVVVMYEEYAVDILKMCFADMSKVNSMFSWAVSCAKNKSGSVENTLNSDLNLKRAVLINHGSQDGTLAERLIKKLRAGKCAKDNLGEELLTICLHLLSSIKEPVDYKYMILTDDKKAIHLFNKAKDNSDKYTGRKSIAIITTAKLCQFMKMAGVISQEEQILEMLSGCYGDGWIKVICSGMYELQPREKKMTLEEFSKEIMLDEIKVYC